MENFFDLVPLVVYIPLLGMIINLFFGGRLGERGVSIIAVGASASAFLVAVLLWIAQVDTGYAAAIVDAPILASWIEIPSGGVSIDWQFRVDTLSVTMMLVVTSVGTLIHLYAVGYMHGDERFPRFFVYMNMFLVFMLLLVSGNNFLMMFVGWEGVGLCSYLLIGFWFDKPGGEGWKNSDAARKAFIVNRIGDVGLILGVLLTFWTFGTLDYYLPGEEPMAYHAEKAEAEAPPFVPDLPAEPEETHAPAAMGVFNQAEVWLEEGHAVEFGSFSVSIETMITIITLLFLLGATGKSAQIPLFVWLPDAMAGPTPVSALIHAATMVTAGVYMMVRANVLYHASDVSSFVVTMIGATTALVAGFIAVGQWDIKRVLAYSTVSQLGFMVAAVGVGGYVAAMFHLTTHAFFKALLFLASGSVIHGMEHGHHHLAHAEHGGDHEHHDDGFDPQDMRFMGGLRHKMPRTYWTYLFGTLALAGVIPFAGFWSKDEILVDSLNAGLDYGRMEGYIGFGLLLVAAVFTAFYMWRQISMVFYGEPRHDAADHAEESGNVMVVPLMALAFFSLVIGFINIPTGFPVLDWLFGEHKFASWLEESVTYAHAGSFNVLLATLAVALALAAIYVARAIYNDDALKTVAQQDPLETDEHIRRMFAWSNAKLYWDDAYYAHIVFPYRRAAYWLSETLDWAFWHDFVHERVIYRGYRGATDVLTQPVDKGIIDRSFNKLGDFIRNLASRVRVVQTGYVRTYALSVLFGALLVMFIILFPVIRDLLGV